MRREAHPMIGWRLDLVLRVLEFTIYRSETAAFIARSKVLLAKRGSRH